MDTAIQIFSLIGLGSGIVYIIGGCIVLLYLSRLGIGEFQILSIKYLIVGIYFLVSISIFSIGIMTISGILISTLRGLFPVSSVNIWMGLFFGLCWLVIVAFYISLGTKLINTNQYAIFTSILLLLPLNLMFRYELFSFVPSYLMSTSMVVFIYLTTAVFIIFRFVGVYADTMSTPPLVRFAIEKESRSMVKAIGLPTNRSGVTEAAYLLDESDKFYILRFGEIDTGKILELRKEIIKALVWDDLQKANKTPEKPTNQ